jgi:hypothetical protein
MLASIEKPITDRAGQIRTKFQALLDKTNKENPRPQDVSEGVDNINARYVYGKMIINGSKRFTRSDETLARVRKLSRHTAGLQFNIATLGSR